MRIRHDGGDVMEVRERRRVLQDPIMDTARRVAMVVLIAASVLTGATAVILYLGRGPEALFGERIVVVPASGPVGMRPFLEPHGFSPAGKTVFLCPTGTGSVRDCVQFGS